MTLRRRELIGGALAIATALLTGVPASAQEVSLGKASALKIGGSKIFSVASTRVLVFRSSASKYFGFVATCPSDSKNLLLSSVKAGRVSCQIDKTVFSLSTGKKLSGPSAQSLQKVPLKISKGFLIAILLPVAIPSPTASSTPEPTVSSAPGEELTTSSRVPVGGGVKVSSSRGEIMVVQATPGNFAAFSTICNHAGCAVSTVTSRSIICECHGSEFSTSDGSVSRGPATQALKQYALVERNGTIFLQ